MKHRITRRARDHNSLDDFQFYCDGQVIIIQLDAAMTLVKRHIRRLWYPEPGSSGEIASRPEHAMTKAQFNAAVCDRLSH